MRLASSVALLFAVDASGASLETTRLRFDKCDGAASLLQLRTLTGKTNAITYAEDVVKGHEHVEASGPGVVGLAAIQGEAYDVQLSVMRISFILGYMGIVFYVSLLFRECTMLPMYRLGALAEAVASTLRTFWEDLMSLAFPGAEDFVDAQVRKQVVELRLEVVRRAAQLCLDLMAPVIIIVAVFAIYHGLWGHWGQISSDIVQVYLYRWDWSGANIFFLACTIAVAFPSWVTPRNITLYYMFDTARVVVLDINVSCTTMAFTFTVQKLATLMMSLACGDVSFTTVVNGLASTVQCCLYAYVAAGTSWLEPFPFHTSSYIARHVIFVMGTAFLCGHYDNVCTERIRATILKKSSSNTLADVEELFSVLCDAVVHLGQDLEITRPAPQLAALLLQGSHRSLEGSSFLDLMIEEDVKGFQNHLNRLEPSSRQPEDASSINLRLRAASGTWVQIKLFISRFPGDQANGQLNYIVGVVELGFRSAHVKAARASSESPQLNRLPSLSDSDASSSSAESDNVLDILMPLAGDQAKSRSRTPTITVAFDALSDNLKILSFTPAFAFLCGVVPDGSSLSSWIVDSKSFVEWVQAFLKESASSTEARQASIAPKAPSMNIVLRTPLTAHVGFEFTAKCLLVLDDLSSSRCSSDQPFLVYALLRKLRRRQFQRGDPVEQT